MIGRLSFDLLKDLSRSPEMEVIPFPAGWARALCWRRAPCPPTWDSPRTSSCPGWRWGRTVRPTFSWSVQSSLGSDSSPATSRERRPWCHVNKLKSHINIIPCWEYQGYMVTLSQINHLDFPRKYFNKFASTNDVITDWCGMYIGVLQQLLSLWIKQANVPNWGGVVKQNLMKCWAYRLWRTEGDLRYHKLVYK